MNKLLPTCFLVACLMWVAPLHADQSCGPGDCRPAAAQPFTDVYSFGSTIGAAGDGAGGTDAYLYIVQSQQMSADVHWVALRTGSVTAMSCRYRLATEVTAGTFSFEVNGPSGDTASLDITTPDGADNAYYSANEIFTAGDYAVTAGDAVDLYIDFGTFEGTLTLIYCMVEVSGTM